MEEHRGTDELFGEAAEDFDPNGPADDGNPFGTREAEITLAVDVDAYVGRKRAAIAAHRSQVTDTTFFLEMPDEVFRGRLRHGVVHRAGRRRHRPSTGLDLPLTAVRLHLVRHGRAAAGWDDDPDPPLDDVGRDQADAVAERLAATLGRPVPVVTSPLLRCRQTAAPIAARWGVDVEIEPLVAEIPSPEGVPMGERVAWLRSTMAGTWSDLGPRYVDFRDAVVADSSRRTAPSGRRQPLRRHQRGDRGRARRRPDGARGRSTTARSPSLDVDGGALHLVEGGHEADTLIR